MHRITTSTHLGIQGVSHIFGTKPGPTTAIMACVHGGERAGLHTFDRIRAEINPEALSGSLLLILVNLPAYRHSENLLKKGLERIDVIKQSRYIDHNINRFATHSYIEKCNTKESRRLFDLESLRSTIDFAIDIHSTTSPAPSMAIYLNRKGAERWSAHLDVENHLIGLTDHMRGQSLLQYLQKSYSIHGVAIETGFELDTKSYQNGRTNTLSFLSHTGNINYSTTPNKSNKKNHIIEVYDSIYFHNNTFKSQYLNNNQIAHGSILPSGTYIAYDGIKDIVLDRNSIILLPTNNIIHVGEEYCFLGTMN